MFSKSVKSGKFDSAPQKNETEVGKKLVDHIISRRTFEPLDKPQVGIEFFIFRQQGDSIEGTICGHAITNFRRSSSYPIKLDDGRIVEIFGNKLLHRIIERGELIFSRVRIQYIGREYTNFGGHARKIYRVYQIKNGTEALVESEKSK